MLFVISSALVPQRVPYACHVISVFLNLASFVMSLLAVVLVYTSSKNMFVKFGSGDYSFDVDYTTYIKVVTTLSFVVSSIALYVP